MSTALKNVQKFFPGVTEVEDAGRNAVIEVTKADQTKATRGNHKECAMALACKRKYGLDGVIISVGRAYLVRGAKAVRYSVPEQISREIISFDRNGTFAPGEYRLLKPGYTEKLGRHYGGDNSKSERTKRTEPKHMTEGIRVSLNSKFAA